MSVRPRAGTERDHEIWAVEMEHYVRREPIPYGARQASSAPQRRLRRILVALRGVMGDRKPSPCSALAPRRPDGSGAKVFACNNDGGGGR